ncbi:general stress protein [Pannus brasiliensis CCIBt3594]|uniref:General stress protein n=1 Tax=Pannus brasiliensis CCIBt3594 TaxID=1427578 RepID=A0AAW9QXQ0_9CHRO
MNSESDREKRAVGTFSSRADAESAIHALRSAGFPLERVSVIARDANRSGNIAGVDARESVENRAGEGAATGAVAGGALGGITGLLVGLGALAIPGIGPVVVAGAEATVLATTLAGGAIGAAAGGLVGSLIGLGIPEDRARFYSDRVAAGDYLVMVRGTEEEIRRAEAILNRGHIGNFGVYDAPVTGSTGDTGRTAIVNEPDVIVIDRREEQIR